MGRNSEIPVRRQTCPAELMPYTPPAAPTSICLSFPPILCHFVPAQFSLDIPERYHMSFPPLTPQQPEMSQKSPS